MNVLRNTLEKLTAAAEQAAIPSDPWRLGLHLMPPIGWLNDPNGLSCFQGEYHVFYQYNPFDARCGLKLWGHYRSRDLLTWEQCPPMLYPDMPFDIHGAYSGSALWEEDGLYLYYTGNVKHEGPDFDYVTSGRESNTILAYSPDGVRLGWKRLLMRNRDYPEDLTLHVRDPKVWKQDGRYYMVQGARTKTDEGEVLVFESADKFHWTHINTLRAPVPFGYMWECPDLFEVDGQWILLVSPQGVKAPGTPGFENEYACGYFPLQGDFRGGCALGDFVPLDYGFDFYAPQTFSDRNRRLLIGWMGMPDAEYGNPTAALGWQHCLTIPRELTWRAGRLLQQPAREMDALRREPQAYEYSGQLSVGIPALADILIDCGGDLSLNLSGASLQTRDGELTLTIREGGRTTRRAPAGQVQTLRILADTSALEIFVNGGETVLCTRWYPEETGRTLTLEGQGRAVVYPMNPLLIRKMPVETNVPNGAV